MLTWFQLWVGCGHVSQPLFMLGCLTHLQCKPCGECWGLLAIGKSKILIFSQFKYHVAGLLDDCYLRHLLIVHSVCICDQICQKGSYTYMHSFKTHFSSPYVSYISGSTAHVFNTAESWTVCFHSGLFLKPVWCPQVLGWPSNGPIFPWQADS